MDEQDKLAKAARELSYAFAKFLSAWVDCEGCDQHGSPSDIPGYPFGGSLDDVDADVTDFASQAEKWARAVALKREAHLEAQVKLADQHGFEYDAAGPDISPCPECGAMHQYIGDDEGEHMCHGIRCESAAAADFEDRAYGRD